MRLAYDNALKSATITATNENSNYPVANLYHKWKRKVFKSTTATSFVTATLAYPQTITCIALAYHNLTSGTATLYNSADESLGVWTFDHDKENDMQYGDIDNVNKIIFAFTSVTTVEIGELFAGTDLHYSKSAEQDMPLNSSDTATYSSDRQVAGRQGSVTRSGSVTIPLLTATERAELEDAFKECGTIIPFFLDLWDLSHGSFIPMYGSFSSPVFSVSHDTTDTVSFDFQEVN